MKTLDKKNIQDVTRCTPTQEGMLFHTLEAPDGLQYVSQVCLELSGPINPKIAEAAWNCTVEANDALRTVFQWERVSNPLQVVLRRHAVHFSFLDLSQIPEGRSLRALEDFMRQDREKGFDFQSVPFRVTLVALGRERFAMTVCHHHILYDGWSSGILLKEFFAAYGDLSEGRDPVIPAKISFKDYLRRMDNREKKAGQTYWRDYLGGVTEPTLVADGLDAADDRPAAENMSREIPADLLGRIDALCASQRLTAAALFYLAWGILLHRVTGKDDVLFGTAVSGRPGDIEGIERLVGMCVNTLPLRVVIADNQPLIAAALKLQLDLQSRQPVEHTPLVEISSFAPTGVGPIFDTVVIVENYPLEDQAFAAGEVAVNSFSVFEMTNYPMAVGVTLGKRANINAAFHEGRFEAHEVEVLLQRFIGILQSIASRPYDRIGSIQLISAAEEKDLLYTFNNTEHEIPNALTLADLIQRQEERAPGAVALVGKSLGAASERGNHHITYGELWRRALHAAFVLQARGAKAGGIVGIMMPRSLELAVGLVAITRFGAAYLPLAPDAPARRNGSMLADCSVEVILCAGKSYERGLPEFTGNILDVLSEEFIGHEAGVCANAASPEDWAYAIYTSGSTGIPKGVAIRHRNIVNTLMFRKETYGLNANHRALQLFPVIFDGFVTSFFTPLISGSRIILPGDDDVLEMATVTAAITRQRVTHLICTPSLFQVIVDHLSPADAASLEAVTLAGEACNPYVLEIARKKNPRLDIANEYGVTEASVLSTMYRLQEQSNVITIGGPIWNSSLYILDTRGRLQPTGVIGELCLAGIGVADGYVNRPELTAERFVQNPYLPGTLIYKTGDAARRLPDGRVQLAGRLDRQVKVRGFRIEPAEIEARLLRYEAIREAAVTVKEDGSSGPVLCAYIVADKTVPASVLRHFLEGRLPFYMIPNHFIQLPQLPRTHSGKILVDALPHPASLARTAGFTVPGRRLESEIVSVWQEILKKDKIGIHDNFFDLGGNSLVAIRVAGRLKEKLNRDVPVLMLFRYPTVAALANAFEGVDDRDPQVKDRQPEQSMASASQGYDIACIGMAARLPEAADIDEFWENLINGEECIRRFSQEELLEAGVPAELLDNPSYVPAKGYLECVDYFDEEFFGYTPAQAEWMDPQVRLFHECCWEALEDAGYDPDEYNGKIGLYAGANLNFPWLLQKKGSVTSPSEEFELVSLNSNSFTTLVAYRLNLTGPAVTIQTACSTSLAAIDAACQGLFSRRCDMALAGGVSVILPAKSGYVYQEGMVKSPDGSCRAFDAGADGTSSGDGVGMVVLKPLSRARQDRDRIYAVVKGSAVNNDGGRRVGYSAPGPEGQAEVIRDAMAFAGVEARTIGYVEAHGTGTPLGDPIEIQGLTLAFGQVTPGSCGIGSVKTNIGHLDAAAGVAGFIKACLAIFYGMIPPSLHFETPNPAIDFERSPFYVVSQLQPWVSREFPRRAGVSSFGIGGTNAHAVLEEAPEDETLAHTVKKGSDRRRRLLILSARSEEALDTVTANLADYLKRKMELEAGDVAYTLQAGRRHFPYRRFVVCSGREEAVDLLKQKQDKKETGPTPQGKPPVVFLFPGLGGQYKNMGRELYETEPDFRDLMDECGQLSASILGIDVRSILYPRAGASEARVGIDSFNSGQAAMFALEYSLAKTLILWGVRPSAMIGYSFGEYAAACISGVMTLEDALGLLASRGRLIEENPGGAMTSVPLPGEDVLPLLTERLSLAIDNGPSCIVAGEDGAVADLERELKGRKIFCMRLPNSHALHSHMMEPVLEAFAEAVKKIELKKPAIPYVSNVTGTWIEDLDAIDPGYWVRHLRETVRFCDGLDAITQQPDAVYIEVGPGRDLRSLVMRRLDDRQARRVVNLLPPEGHDREADDYLLHRLGYLWQEGVVVDWRAFNHHHPAQRVSLPSYPFQKHYYPVDTANQKGLSQALRSTRSPNLKDWFYIPQWRRQPLAVRPNQDAADDSGLLLFARPGGAQEELAAGLKELSGEKSEIIDPGEGNAIEWSFAAREGQDTNTCHIVYIVPEAAESHEYALHLLEIARRIPGLTARGDVRLSIITFHVFDVTGEEPIHPGNAMAAGLVKVIPQEIPGVRCRHIDVAAPVCFADVIHELRQPEFGVTTALRGRHRWQLYYEPVLLNEPSGEESPLKRNGVYLVTGGLGNIGFVICKYLLSNYHANLVIVGRSHIGEGPVGAAGEKISRLRELETLPGAVRFFTADVADYSRMQAVVTVAEERFGPIDGVFHMAGIVGGDSIAGIHDLTEDVCMQQFRAKRDGSLVLEKIFKYRRLDFCWLTSSIASVLGGIHFFAYAAANAWMDAFGRYMNRSSRNRWLVVNWDALEPELAESAVERILAGGLTEVVLSTGGGLEERIDRWIRLRTLNAQEPKHAAAAFSPKQRPGIISEYKAPKNEIEQAIVEVWSEVFGYGGIGVNDDFFELGGDSLKALTALSKIHRRLGREIPVKEMFSRPTAAKLAALIDPASDADYRAIPTAPDMDYYPLSSAQKRLYVLQQMEPGSVAYNETQCVTIEGEVDRHRIESTFRQMIDRHEALRTSIVQVDGVAMQAIHPSTEVPFRLDLLEEGDLSPEELIKSYILPFDLAKPPFLRAATAFVDGVGAVMIIDMHHSITDAVSLQVFIDEFALLYNGQSLPPLQCRYRDFACWQQQRIFSPALKAQQEYWLAKFQGDIPVLNLPADYARPALQDYEGSSVKKTIPRQQTALIKTLSADTGATTFMVLLAAYYVFLARTCGQDDLVVGFPVAGRPHAECQEMIGIFVNTLALRRDVNPEQSFGRLLESVRQAAIEAFENQDFQFEELVELLDVKRDPSRNPLFDTYFVFERVGRREVRAGDTVFTSLELNSRVSKFDLVFNVFEEEDNLHLTLEYAVKLFKPETAERMLNHFMEILRQVIADPAQKPSDIDFLTAAEKDVILRLFNANRADFPCDRTVWDLIGAQSERNGNRLAMVCQDRQVTYGELARGVQSLSVWYIENGMKAGQLLGILLDRSIEMAMAILAAWNIGVAYIPLDPRHPVNRIMEVTDDADCRILVSVDRLATDELLEKYKGTVLQLKPEIFQRDACRDTYAVDVHSTAYVFYTSGSTGKPKGAMVEHIGMTNHMFAKIDDLGIGEDAIVAQNASHTFDISIWQFFVALIKGGRTVIYPNHLVLDPDNLLKRVEDHGITILEVVPSYLSVMLDTLGDRPRRFSRLGYLMVTGEVVKPNLVQRWFARYPHIKMVNAYGPTEAADDITHYVMDRPVAGERVPVGKPVQNMTIYIVDSRHRLCPIGVKGEIWVSGIGVGRGYVNDHDKTMKVFDSDPFSDEPGIRLYKTGDLGRWLPDGAIDFFGRKDYQVKIRGFRIELGEIENRLLNLGLAREATVIDREDEKGEKMLCAYVVPRDSLTPADIRQRLKQVLPDYMVPATVTVMDVLPLNDNGKIDRKALPDPRQDEAADTVPYVTAAQLEDILQKPEARIVKTGDRAEVVIEEKSISSEDKDKILNVFNDTQTPYPQDKTIVELFRAQARKTPDRVALAFEERQLSYRELDVRTDSFAALIRNAGGGAGAFVGLLADRSLELVMGVYAILKSGAAYVPLSFQFPEQRMLHILKACDVRLVVTDDRDTVHKFGVEALDIGDSSFPKNNLEEKNQHAASPLDPAYVMFTSGTTGVPKGVVVEHRSLVNFSLAMIRRLEFDESDIVLSLFTLTFDMSGTEIFAPLVNGQKVVIGNFAQQLFTGATAEILQSRCITVFQGTPSNLQLLIGDEIRSRCLTGLRLVLAGAEPFPQVLSERLSTLTSARIFNLYGPTEATTYATCKELTGGERVTIGSPIDNARVYILNPAGGLQPIGVPGELCIGGDGVARGYIKQEILTAEQFLQDPFVAGGRIYKTGDIARFLPDGDIQFLGRSDYQVQIDGFRVELGEIEHCIAGHPHVRQVVAAAGIDGRQKKYLAAYLVADERLVEAALRSYISKKLPPFMIPGHFIQLERMPLNPNGKVDRSKLPAPGVMSRDEVEFVAPSTELEETVAAAWKQVLQVEKVGINENFFDLGGNSLAVIQLNRVLKERLQRDIPVVAMYEHLTVKAFVRFLEQGQARQISDPMPQPETDRSAAMDRAKNSRSQQKNKRRLNRND